VQRVAGQPDLKTWKEQTWKEPETVEPSTTHSVYEHADGRRETIKNGFSWPAFLFGPLWAWRKGMGSLGFVLLAVALLLQSMPLLFIESIGEAGIVLYPLVTVSVVTWIGGQGNAWLRKSVLDRGFKLVSSSPPAT